MFSMNSKKNNLTSGCAVFNHEYIYIYDLLALNFCFKEKKIKNFKKFSKFLRFLFFFSTLNKNSVLGDHIYQCTHD